MNIVDKILFDPITKGLKFFTKGGAVVDLVEYASNDGSGGTAANTTYTTGSVAGSAGSQFVSVNSTDTVNASATQYKVSFPTPIRAANTIFLQVSPDGGLTWSNTSSGMIVGRLALAGTNHGIYVISNDATSVMVNFGNAGRMLGLTYGAVGAAWSSVAGNVNRWRLAKYPN